MCVYVAHIVKSDRQGYLSHCHHMICRVLEV